MKLHRLFYTVVTRSFFLMLCACAGQTMLLPAHNPSDTNSGASLLDRNNGGTTLEIPDHPSSSEYLAVNDRGDVAVSAGDKKATYAYVAHRPYRSADFEREDFPGAAVTTVTGINNRGTIVGFFATNGGEIVAFSKSKGSWTRYSDSSNATEYLGVNDAGVAVGFHTDRRGNNHAFERDLKTGKSSPIHPGARSAAASGIDDDGNVIGYLAKKNGDVKGFFWKAGRFTTFSYPGAVETKPLGISPNATIVGTYTDALGKIHGFILRDLQTKPRWKSFDEARARGMTVLTGMNVRGDMSGYYRNEKRREAGIVCCLLPDDGPSAPPVIPVWGLGGDTLNADPGATPDQHLFAVVEDTGYMTNAQLAKNCPGVSSTSTCQPYKYIDLFIDQCNTPVTKAAYAWADANDESAFQHVYPNGATFDNRIEWNATPNPTGPNCKPDNPEASMRMNAADPAFNTYLSQNVWNGTSNNYDFPAPYGIMEDQASTFGGVVVGGSGEVSTEYGSGTKPSGFANQVGNSYYHAATDWETAIGTFVNGACIAVCHNVGLNSVATGAGNVGVCAVISGGHCHAQYQSGMIDDQAAIDNICSTVTGGNLGYLEAERPLYAGRNGFQFLNGQTMTVEVNTAANLYSHTSDGCANTKIVVVEPSYGEGGLGDVTGGYQVRLVTLAYRWLVPNPATSIPDRVISLLLPEGQTKTEIAYFFEDTLVPVGAETAVPKFVWNGSVKTVGNGCPSVSGDYGGAVALVVQCVGSDGIFCQQYQHLFVNQTDYGKAAACLNTSTTTENVSASWFRNDPIGSYSYQLSLQGGEMTSVPYQGVPGGSIALPTCTNKAYCTGQSTLSTQVAPFRGDGSDQLCGQCGMILLEND